VSWYQQDKTDLGLLEQETMSGRGIIWAIWKSASCPRQITTPAPHHSVFLQAGCPSCRPTNSIKALKAILIDSYLTESPQEISSNSLVACDVYVCMM